MVLEEGPGLFEVAGSWDRAPDDIIRETPSQVSLMQTEHTC